MLLAQAIRTQTRYLSRTSMGRIQESIESKLQAELKPSHLEVINESYMHNVPKGSETHFKVVVVSESFDGMKLLERHRTVNGVLKKELEEDGVHALSIVSKTPAQWSKSNAVDPSPNCRGGSKFGLSGGN